MSEGVVAPEQTPFVWNGSKVFLQHLFRIDDRADLEKVELPRPVAVQIDGELDFHRPAHGFRPVSHRHLEQFGKGEDLLFQYAAEGNNLAPFFVGSVVDGLVVGRKGGGDVLQAAICLSLFHLQLENVKAVVHLEVFAYVLHIESIELCLGFTQGHLQLAHLQHLVRMERTDAQGLAAVDDVFSQAERQGGDALFGLLFPDGIVVQGAEDTRDVRVETAAVVLACHLLENDRHLLLVDDVARGSHVGLGVAVVDGGIDRLDGTRQHPQHLVLVFQTGYHIGGVNAGERLYRKEVPDVEMVADEQGHLQVERPRGRPVDFAVLRKGDFAAAAREIDPRFEVERQFPGQ